MTTLLAAAAEAPAAHDEMVDGGGRVRPHWRALLGAFSALPPGTLPERARRLDRAFEEEGVATLLAGEAGRARRPWRCDPVPLILPAGEFAALEAGLAQRARLLSRILDDLYGPQRLLADGLLPASLVFGAPSFLRACRVPAAAPYPRLTFYGADLLRGPDGAWHVLADRCGGANGVGFAAENRALLARALPEGFRALQVRTLRPFFDLWLDALQRMAPDGVDNPRLALLTPGARHETWLEHLYLSRELGLELVEAGDLTVRDGAVFLKTLRGLQRVDVILRRVKGEVCDPLELQPGSGVPGLMHALRSGAVRLANAPGSVLAEAPGLLPFLPGCARALLGEELALRSLETVWLGEEVARRRVLAGPDDWHIRSAYDPGAAPALGALDVFGGEVPPAGFVATRAMAPSTAPRLRGDRLEPASVLMRVFLLRDAEGDWRAMPGGLAHLLEHEAPIAAPPATRGPAKDVWVLAEDATDIVGPGALRAAPLPIRRSTGELPSRVADDLYWLGRYLERLEGAARLVRALLARLLRGATLPREMAEVRALMRCLQAAGLLSPELAASPADGTALPRALLAAAGPSGALTALIEAVERPQAAARDRLTLDMWGALAALSQEGRAALTRTGTSDALAEAATGIIRACTVVAGIAAENMVRGGAWLFLDLGRRVERAACTARNLAHALDQKPVRLEAGLRLALELCDSALTYRARYLAVVQPAPVLDLVMADPGNPRALGYQLTAVAARLGEVGAEGDELAATAARLAARPEAMVGQVLGAADWEGEAARLPAELLVLEAEIAALSDAIARRYVSHVRTRVLGEEVGGK